MVLAFLIAGTINRYLRFYERYLEKKWENLSPMDYGMILIFIAVMGWILMRNGMKR